MCLTCQCVKQQFGRDSAEIGIMETGECGKIIDSINTGKYKTLSSVWSCQKSFLISN